MTERTSDGRHARSLSARTWTGRILVWPVCVMAMALHLAFGHEDYSTLARLQAGALCCLALVCTAYAPVRVMPATAIGIGYLYLALGQPVFTRGVSFSTGGRVYIPTRALEDATLAALAYALTVAVVALLVDRLTRRFAWRLTHRIDRGNEYGSTHTLVARFLAGLSIGLRTAASIGITFGSLQQPIGILASPLISMTFLYWDAERTGRASARLLFWSMTAYLAALGLMSGMLQEVLVPGIMAGALMWAHRARLPWTLFAIGAAVLIILTPAKSTYRQLAWFEAKPTLFDRLWLWGVALEQTYLDEQKQTDFTSSIERTGSRFGTLGQVAHIFEAVPDRVPFAGPDRWIGLTSFLVPRVVWPEKPIMDTYYNRNYTYTFRIQTKRSGGSITLPSVGDGYWRMGWLGVFIEAALTGILLGAAQGVSRGGTRTALLLAAALMVLRTDSHVFGTVVGIMQQTLVALVVAVVAQKLTTLLSTEEAPNALPDHLPAG